MSADFKYGLKKLSTDFVSKVMSILRLKKRKFKADIPWGKQLKN